LALQEGLHPLVEVSTLVRGQPIAVVEADADAPQMLHYRAIDEIIACDAAAFCKFRLAPHRARPPRAVLAQGPRSGGKKNQSLRLSRNLDELRLLLAWNDLLKALATFTIPNNLLSIQKNE
jgi:hypothetical protein